MFNIIILGIASLLTDISSEMVYPILPVYLVVTLGASPVLLGFIEGFAESTASLVKVFSGYFSDKLRNRKGLSILGYSLSTLGKFFFFLSNSWALVFVGRSIDRFGKGVRTAPRDALIADSSDAKKRGAAFGLHRSLDSLGAVIGVWLAYYFFTSYKGGYKAVFLFSLIPAVLGVLVLFAVREKKSIQHVENKSVLKLSQLKQNFKSLNPRLKIFLLITFIFTLGNSSNQFLLLRAKNIGFSAGAVILLYLVYNITYALSAYPLARLSDKIGRKIILVIGYLFYGLVYLGFAFTHSEAFTWFLFGLYGLYIGFTDGVEKAFVSDVSPAHLRATLIGLHATLVGIGLFPASLLAGLLWKIFSPTATFLFGGIMGILAAAGLWIFIQQEDKIGNE